MSSYTTAIVSPHMPSSFTKPVRARETFFFLLSYPETKELPMGRKKRFGCYEQEQLNLPREYSVFDGSQCIVNNRKFKMWRRQLRKSNKQ